MKVAVYNIKGESVGREIELPDNVFGLELNDKLEHVIYLVSKQYLANQRQGTHKSKQRNEIAGSTRKLIRQKGTGGARRGNIKTPLFPGGGRVFGPQPRDYEHKLNKKVKVLARKAALSAKAKEGRIIVIEDFTMAEPKTKSYRQFLESVKVGDKALADGKSLLVLNVAQAPAKPVRPTLPRSPRGAKKRAQYAQSIKAYSAAVQQYRQDVKAYAVVRAEYDKQLESAYGNIYLSSRNISNASLSEARMLHSYDILNTQYLVLSEGSVGKLVDMLA
jgi:large subunit ribosomal protein L4